MVVCSFFYDFLAVLLEGKFWNQKSFRYQMGRFPSEIPGGMYCQPTEQQKNAKPHRGLAFL